MSAANQPQTQTRAHAAPTRAPSVELSTAQMAIAGVLLLAAFVAVFWVFVSNQFVYAIEEPADWGHTLLVPFISGYFVWLRREDLMAQPFKANWLGVPVVVPEVAETTALGAAVLAALGSGAAADLAGATRLWQLDREFVPTMSGATRERLLAGWRRAVARAL